jgi:hypothetical protein
VHYGIPPNVRIEAALDNGLAFKSTICFPCHHHEVPELHLYVGRMTSQAFTVAKNKIVGYDTVVFSSRLQEFRKKKNLLPLSAE